MKRHIFLRKLGLLFGDLLLTGIAVLGSFALRLDLGPLFYFYWPQGQVFLLLALMVKPIVYYLTGMYRRMWVYASTRELIFVIYTVSMASALTSGLVIALLGTRFLPYFPRSVLAIDWLLSLLLIGGLRFSQRWLADRQHGHAARAIGRARRTLIVGAGEAGVLVVRELQKNPQMNLLPVCFVDDDPAKQSQQIHGITVAGKITDLPRLIDQQNIQEVLVAIPSAPGRIVRQVMDICRTKDVPYRTMPGIYELIGGQVNLSRLREVQISDLLRRAPVQTDDHRVGLSLTGKRILVTGAGGSIGSELCRQIARWSPASLILLGHGENSIFQILTELNETFPNLAIQPVIADVRDLERLHTIFEAHRPQVVFHAAAHKHVPLMEANVEEAVTNNILGTRNVVEVSLCYNTERMVMISTDKAVRPSSVMGATKRLAELLVLEAANRSGREFSVVRFGNVLGSRGSVVPYFKRQIERGGPVTITHPEMKRYFMTIPEAVHLVLQAMSLGSGGEVFVLRMGEQIRILDLAEDLIRLAGLEPGRDIQIRYTGIRPGEKLSEELWDKWSHFQPTAHPDVLRLDEEHIFSGEPLQRLVEELLQLAREGDSTTILRLLDETLPGASVRQAPPPQMTTVV
ncbi:MAG: nucleoside-diphosphate sugar epimerase/dehydratase [Anaerolineales bacterium]